MSSDEKVQKYAALIEGNYTQEEKIERVKELMQIAEIGINEYLRRKKCQQNKI